MVGTETTNNHDMKAPTLVSLFATALLTASSFAGEYTAVTHTPPSSECGVGWYVGFGGGANVYQDYGDPADIVVNGTTFQVDTNDHIGGFGGIKFGYVFGNGTWRFALEEDWFYNGVDATATFKDVNGTEVASASGLFNTAAFMTNGLIKYAPNGGCGFQPYILGGIGGWWGETGGDVSVTVGNVTRDFRSKDNGGFAFQMGVGFDYYFNPKMAFYTEYKFLDYTNAGGEFTNSNVGQHLVGGGFKFNF